MNRVTAVSGVSFLKLFVLGKVHCKLRLIQIKRERYLQSRQNRGCYHFGRNSRLVNNLLGYHRARKRLLLRPA
jgi:hypothetical protein